VRGKNYFILWFLMRWMCPGTRKEEEESFGDGRNQFRLKPKLMLLCQLGFGFRSSFKF